MNHADARVAVVCSVYNRLDVTRRFLDNLALSSSEYSGAVILDDGSTDGTVEYLDNLDAQMQEHLNWVVSIGPEQGLYAQWNAGWLVATAEGYGIEADHILFVNNDATWGEGDVRRCSEELARDPGCGVFGYGGWWFMVRADLPTRFDEEYGWWYGDTDFFKQVEAEGLRVDVRPAPPTVHHEGSASSHNAPVKDERIARLLAGIPDDARRFSDKWSSPTVRPTEVEPRLVKPL